MFFYFPFFPFSISFLPFKYVDKITKISLPTKEKSSDIVFYRDGVINDPLGQTNGLAGSIIIFTSCDSGKRDLKTGKLFSKMATSTIIISKLEHKEKCCTKILCVLNAFTLWVYEWITKMTFIVSDSWNFLMVAPSFQPCGGQTRQLRGM